jgi:hypothetical protein
MSAVAIWRRPWYFTRWERLVEWATPYRRYVHSHTGDRLWLR